MVRRVKAYLKSMKVITDEEELHRMSQEVEPPSGGLAPPPLPVINTVKISIKLKRTPNNKFSGEKEKPESQSVSSQQLQLHTVTILSCRGQEAGSVLGSGA